MIEEEYSKKQMLDVRTKLLLVFVNFIILLCGERDGLMNIVYILVNIMPFVLFILYGQFKSVLKYMILYIIAFICEMFVTPYVSGNLSFIVFAFFGIFMMLIPLAMTGYFFISTTKISEFSSAMDKMHIPRTFTIPLLVMFRFFPTLAEEYTSIDHAMKMRGIGLGKGGILKNIEYRMIPFLMSSVKIGDELTAASLTRGIDAPYKRTNICKIKFGIADYIAMLFCVFCFAILLLTKLNII